MNEGRGKTKTWMTAFITEYKRLNNDSTETDFYHQLPDWSRFHLDHESALTNVGTSNWPFMLKAMVLENYPDRGYGAGHNRWDSEPVPGIIDSTGQPATMKDLWQNTPLIWRNGIGDENHFWNDPLQSALNADYGFDIERDSNSAVIHNRDIYLWYHSICQRATDAALNECAYEVISNPSTGFYPNCKASNYSHALVHAIQPYDSPHGWGNRIWSTFGWHRNGTAFGNYQPDGERGVLDPLSHGYQLPETSNGRWFISHDQAASGSFSAPQLYAIGSAADGTTSWKNYKEVNQYVPGATVDDDLRWDVSLRWHRRWLESIIGSYADDQSIAAPWLKVVPWIPITHTKFNFHAAPTGPDPDHDVMPDDVNRLLSLCKSKAIPEFVVWDNDNTGNCSGYTTDQYPEFKRVYDQVYGVAFKSYSKVYASNTGDACHSDERLTDSNYRWGSLSCSSLTPPLTYKPYSVEIAAASAVGQAQPMTGLQVDVVLAAQSPGIYILPNETLRLFIECDAELNGTSIPINGTNLYGLVQIWEWPVWTGNNPTVGHWRNWLIGDVASDQTKYIFSAPASTDTGTQYSVSTRRQFDLHAPNLTRFVNNATQNGDLGQVRIRLQHVYAKDPACVCSATLTSRWDLVQLVRADYVTALGGSFAGIAAQPQGADTNLDGMVTLDDAEMFLDESAAGSPAGDYNGDNAADATDVDEFVTDFVGG